MNKLDKTPRKVEFEIEPNHKETRLVVGVSYQPYKSQKDRSTKISDHEALGWVFMGETDRGLCFYLFRKRD